MIISIEHSHVSGRLLQIFDLLHNEIHLSLQLGSFKDQGFDCHRDGILAGRCDVFLLVREGIIEAGQDGFVLQVGIEKIRNVSLNIVIAADLDGGCLGPVDEAIQRIISS